MKSDNKYYLGIALAILVFGMALGWSLSPERVRVETVEKPVEVIKEVASKAPSVYICNEKENVDCYEIDPNEPFNKSDYCFGNKCFTVIPESDFK